MDFSCHRLWGYYEFQMHFLSCQWGGKRRLALRRFVATPFSVIASEGRATLNGHPRRAVCVRKYGNARQTALGPGWEFLYVTLFGFYITPFFGSQLRSTAVPISCWRLLPWWVGLNLVKGRQDLWGTGLSFKLSFQRSLFIILVSRLCSSYSWLNQPSSTR